MESTGGGNPPPPPKRPTVIRKPEGPPVPGRPAPPVPSSKPDSKTIDSQSNGTQPAAIPPRPSGVRAPRPASSAQSKPAEESGRKRPVITIVSARPMSEVGFRENKPPESAVQSDTIETSEPVPPARPSPQAPPPPPRPSSSVPNTHLDNEEEHKTRQRPPAPAQRPNIPPSVPGRSFPTAVPRPHISPRVPSDDSVHPTSGIPSFQPPPIPKRAYEVEDESISPKADEIPDSELSEAKRPTVVGRPPPVKAPRADINDESGEIKTEEHTMNDVSEDISVTNVISKPKRPTIIRPGRTAVPVVKKDCSDENVSVNKTSVPEFLNTRLKPTVPSSEEKSPVDEPNKAIPAVQRGPPPPPKPKPTILAKPSLAPKPEVARKPLSQQSPETKQNVSDNKQESSVPETGPEKDSPEIKKPASLSKRPTIIRPSRVPPSTSSENIVKSDQGESEVTLRHRGDDLEPSKFPSRLQPPLPSKRPVSMTNIPQAIAQELSMTQTLKSSQSSSQSSENVSGSNEPFQGPRPVARTRPASMMVPSQRPPAPAVRPRTGVREIPSQPPVTSSSAEDVSVEPVPAQKKILGVAVFPQLMKAKDQSQSQSQDVLPNQKIETKPQLDGSSNQRPANRPPPPKKPPHIEESQKVPTSSSDEEFFPTQTKPDRPPVGPPVPVSRVSDQVTSSVEDKKPPVRPIAPPPAKRQSILDSPEKENEEVTARPRPAGRPPRPGSMPVKGEPPAKPKPPHPGAGSVRKKTDTPSLPARPGPGHPLYHYMMQTPHGVALHDYTGRQEDELTFMEGDVILLLRSVDSEWIMGKLGEQEGIFPRGFIKVKMPLPGEALDDADDSSDDSADIFYEASSAKPDHLGHGPRCRARFDFDGEGPDDLVFEEGDVIRLLERVGLEWRKGECEGRTGLFPLAYVEVIEELPEDDISNSQSTEAKALFDFDGEETDLSFQAGETIHVQYRVNEEWLFGQIGERTGQFPIQFVDHVPADLPPLPRDSIPVYSVKTEPQQAWQDEVQNNPVEDPVCSSTDVDLSGPHCVALYDYPGPEVTDLTFSEGDMIQLVERIDDNWLRGSLHGQTGMFPAEFVQIKVDIIAAVSQQSTQSTHGAGKQYGLALHEFTGESENELTFKAGDQIELQELVQGAEDWRWGVIAGHRGMFPATFVEFT